MSFGEQHLNDIDAIADTFVRGEPVPGIAYGILVDGELARVRGIGTIDLDRPDDLPAVSTVFRIASMTKSFTAATLLLLRDDGELRLDDPVADIVPELVGSRPITLRQLLTMSAGLPGDDPWGDRQQGLDLERFAAFLADGPSFAWPIGTAFEYSNLGYGILGRVISNVAGREYRDVVRARLLEPLGMTSTVFEAAEVAPEKLAIGYVRRDDTFLAEPFDGYGALASMGGLFSTVADLGRWVDGFVRARDGVDDDHPLSPASRLEMQQLHRSMPPELTWTSVHELPKPAVAGYGFGLFVIDDFTLGAVVAHSGGYPGFGSNMRWHPASRIGVVVLANRTYYPAGRLAEQLLCAVVEERHAPVRRSAPAPELAHAQEAINRLIDAWDDDLARELFSMNVELDEPPERRRAALDRLRDVHGQLTPSAESATGDSPFHLTWWLEGERGRVKVEITLDPQRPPRVQWFDLTSVPEPDPSSRRLAEQQVNLVNGDGADPDQTLVRVLFGSCTLGPPVAGDALKVTFRVHAERGDLDLTIGRDPATGEPGPATWVPCPMRPPV